MKLIIISGMPAAGKSTVARRISAALGFPVLEKDEIKEALFDTIGYRDLTEKRRLDVAATDVLLRCAQSVLTSGSPLIMVNNFRSDMRQTVQDLVDRCGCSCVTVFLNGDPEVLYARYVERDRKRSRHLGHTFIDRYPPEPGDRLDRSMTREYFADVFEKQGMADFRISGPRIDVEATYPETIDVDALIAQIQAAL